LFFWASPCQEICGVPKSQFCNLRCDKRCDCPSDLPVLNPVTEECVAREDCPEACTEDVAVENDPCNLFNN